MEKLEVFADNPMVPLLRFFELLEVVVQLFLRRESRAVDPGEAVGIFIAVPVAGGEREYLCRADAPGGKRVRPAAEIFPVPARLAGSVERNLRIGVMFVRSLGVGDFELRTFLFQLFHSFFRGKLTAAKGPVFFDDTRHFFLDGFEIIGRELAVFRECDVIVKAVIKRRAVDEHRFRRNLLNRLGHHVSGGVPYEVEAVRIEVARPIFVGDDGQLAVVFDDGGKVAQLAINFAAERGLGEAGADVFRDLQCGDRLVVFQG